MIIYYNCTSGVISEVDLLSFDLLFLFLVLYKRLSLHKDQLIDKEAKTPEEKASNKFLLLELNIC